MEVMFLWEVDIFIVRRSLNNSSDMPETRAAVMITDLYVLWASGHQGRVWVSVGVQLNPVRMPGHSVWPLILLATRLHVGCSHAAFSESWSSGI